MRKSGKLLLGVLSVAALIGTGMGAFIINGTYGSDTDTIGVTTTEQYYSRGFNITAEKAADDGINFDGTGGDLLVTYTVKATAIDGGFTQEALYNPKTWATVAEEYRPNLKVSATHTNVDDTRAAAFNKYVVLPDVATISYETWLAANLKETGYTYEFKVEWNKEALGGYETPNDYFATVDNATGKKVYNEIKSGLEYAEITVTFEAGYYESGTTPDPVVETTGAVTLPDPATSNALLAISGTQENGTVEAGEQTLSLTLEDGYDLEALNVSVDGAAAEPVEMKEVQSGVLSLANPGKKYEGTYTFEKGKTYEFSVVTKASTPDEPEVKYAKVSVAQNENASVVIANASEDGNYEVNSAVSFTAEALNGYRITSVYYTVEGSEDKNVLTDTEGTYSFTVSSEAAHTIVVETDVYDIATVVSAITSSNTTVYTVRGTIVSFNTKGFVVYDGTAMIALFDQDLLDIYNESEHLNKVVEVTGAPVLFSGCPEYTYKNGITVSLLADATPVETPDLDTSITADQLNNDNLSNILYRRIKVTASASVGKYTNFYVDGMGFTSISLFNSTSQFDDGATYEIEGYVGYVSSGKYLYLYEISSTKVEVPATYATVRAATIPNGTVTITTAASEGDQYAVGTKVEWSATPNSGYEVESYWYTVDEGPQQTVASGSLEIPTEGTYVVGATMKQSSSTEEPGGDTPPEETLNSVSFASNDLTATSTYEYKNIEYNNGEHTFNMQLSCGNKGSLSKINNLILLGANKNGTTTEKFNAKQYASDGSVAFANTQYLTSEILADLGETDADTAVANKPITVLDLSIPSSFGKVKDFAFTVAAIDSNVSKGYFVETVINEKGEKEFNYLGSVTPALGDLTYTYTESKNINSIALVTVSSDAFENATRTGFSNFAINTASVA